MSKKATLHRPSYDRDSIIARLMAQTAETPAPAVKAQRATRKPDGTVSFKQAITVKACADALGDTFAWIDKPRKGRYVVAINGNVLTPDEASTIIDAWINRPR